MEGVRKFLSFTKKPKTSKYLWLVFVVFVLVGSIVSFKSAEGNCTQCATSYAGGTYINLCGGNPAGCYIYDGTYCSAVCKPGMGYCGTYSWSDPWSCGEIYRSGWYIKQYLCNNRNPDCRSNPARTKFLYSNTWINYFEGSLITCGTSQLDVYNASGVLQGFMVWYAGVDCGGGEHKECNSSCQCVTVSGPVRNQCSGNSDCYPCGVCIPCNCGHGIACASSERTLAKQEINEDINMATNELTMIGVVVSKNRSFLASAINGAEEFIQSIFYFFTKLINNN